MDVSAAAPAAPDVEMSREQEAAVRLQAAMKGYLSRRALKAVTLDSYPRETCDTSDDDASGDERVSAHLPRSVSESDLDELAGRGSGSSPAPSPDRASRSGRGWHKVADVLARKRIIKEAARIGRGLRHTLDLGSPCSSLERHSPEDCLFLSSAGIQQTLPSLRSLGAQDGVRSIPLKKKHWLEALDARHRYGSNLAHYYAVWKESDTAEHFFTWLDHGGGKACDLPALPRAKLEQEVITYLNRKERAAYEVQVRGGRLFYVASGRPVHTLGEQSGPHAC